MITLLLDTLAKPIGKAIAGTLGALALWGMFAFHYEGKGAAKERAKIVSAGERNAKKADAARADVARLPVERLRDAYERD